MACNEDTLNRLTSKTKVKILVCKEPAASIIRIKDHNSNHHCHENRRVHVLYFKNIFVVDFLSSLVLMFVYCTGKLVY
jgi:hypothetical protein